MRICGIISEYNPFHNGHAFHLEKTRSQSGCDFVICLMSGSFTQRGEPAIFDKWTRAQTAVMNGADLVLELPVLYALRSAEGFADGGVKILDLLKADMIAFGSESEDLNNMTRTAKALSDEPRQYRIFLKENLSRGLSFPAAREQALSRYLDDASVSNLLTGSNAILGVEYLKANLKYKNKLNPVVIKRAGSDYHDTALSGTLSSATAIRAEILLNGLNPAVKGNMPDTAFKTLSMAVENGFIPVKKDAFYPWIRYAMRRRTAEGIALLPDVTEGLENRILKAASEADSYGALIALIKSKRFTQTRIQRMLYYALLDITKEMTAYADHHMPKYIKVLARKKTADPLLSYLANHAKITLVHSSSGCQTDRFIAQDIKSTDVYSLVQQAATNSLSGRDFTTRTVTD